MGNRGLNNNNIKLVNILLFVLIRSMSVSYMQMRGL